MPRATATRSACRCRRAFPSRCSTPVRDPLGDLALRYARTHAPFTARRLRRPLRPGRPPQRKRVLLRLAAEGRLLEGEFRPGGTAPRVDRPGVLRMLRRRSLAKLRQRGRAGRSGGSRPARRRHWQGVVKRRHGARRAARRDRAAAGRAACRRRFSRPRFCRRASRPTIPADLDAVMAAGEVVWVGVEPLGDRDGRIALYLADHLPRLLPPREPAAIARHAVRRHASRARATPSSTTCGRVAPRSSVPLHEAVGGGYPAETVDALWNLVWRGLVTNDTFHALRAFTRARDGTPNAAHAATPGDVPLAPPRAAGRRRTLERGALDGTGQAPTPSTPRDATRRLGHGHGAAAARAPRRADARGGAGGIGSRRLRRRLPGAEGDGRERAASGAATSSRASARRSSRCPARSISCARCVTRPRKPEVVVLAGDRSGESVWRDVEMAAAGRAAAGWTRTDAHVGATVILVDGALVGVSRARRSAAAHVAAGRRAAAIARGARRSPAS